MVAIWSELTVSLKINWKDSIVASTWNINEINSFFLLLVKSYRMLFKLFSKSPKHFLAIRCWGVNFSIKRRFYRVHSIDKGKLGLIIHLDFNFLLFLLSFANDLLLNIIQRYCLGIINLTFKRFLLFMLYLYIVFFLHLLLVFLVYCLESLRLYAMFDLRSVRLRVNLFVAFGAQYRHSFSLNCLAGRHALRSQKFCCVFLIHWQ